MPTDAQVKIATSVLQVLVLIFAGFGTLIYQSYTSETSDLDSGSYEVLGWIFMSVSTVFVYPAYLLALLLLAQVSGNLTDILLFLLGGFITLPVIILSTLNLGIGFFQLGDIDWAFYQRFFLSISSIIIFAEAGTLLYHTFISSIL